jgi:hypothetical protein
MFSHRRYFHNIWEGLTVPRICSIRGGCPSRRRTTAFVLLMQLGFHSEYSVAGGFPKDSRVTHHAPKDEEFSSLLSAGGMREICRVAERV